MDAPFCTGVAPVVSIAFIVSSRSPSRGTREGCHLSRARLSENDTRSCKDVFGVNVTFDLAEKRPKRLN